MYARDRNEKYEIHTVGFNNQVINLIYTYELICLSNNTVKYYLSNN